MTLRPGYCCIEFDLSVEEGMITYHETALEDIQDRIYTLLPPEGDGARVIYFCPFCGGPLGGGLKLREHLVEISSVEADDGRPNLWKHSIDRTALKLDAGQDHETELNS